MSKAYYIITIHNKEHLITEVLQGIVNSHALETQGEIICVIDGCTDNTEQKIDEFNSSIQLTKLYSANTHEIAAINAALTYIRTDCNPAPDDVVFMLQDDIVLEEHDINKKISAYYSIIPNLGYVSFRLGVDTVLHNDNLFDINVVESEYGHWKQMGLTHVTGKKITFLNHQELVFREVVVRSPTVCIWKHFAKYGVFDAALCPYNYDCFDFSIRMLEAGFRNAVIGMKFRSDINWGGMREEADNPYNKKKDEIFERNLRYLIEKHRKFLSTKTNKG